MVWLKKFCFFVFGFLVLVLFANVRPKEVFANCTLQPSKTEVQILEQFTVRAIGIAQPGKKYFLKVAMVGGNKIWYWNISTKSTDANADFVELAIDNRDNQDKFLDGDKSYLLSAGPEGGSYNECQGAQPLVVKGNIPAQWRCSANINTNETSDILCKPDGTSGYNLPPVVCTQNQVPCEQKYNFKYTFCQASNGTFGCYLDTKSLPTTCKIDQPDVNGITLTSKQKVTVRVSYAMADTGYTVYAFKVLPDKSKSQVGKQRIQMAKQGYMPGNMTWGTTDFELDPGAYSFWAGADGSVQTCETGTPAPS